MEPLFMTRWRYRGLAASLCGTAVLAAWSITSFPSLDSPRITKPPIVQDYATVLVEMNTGPVVGPTPGTTEKETEAIATNSDRGHPGNTEPVSSTEILHECFVPDICIDRYLWALYQRTPK